MDKSPGQSEERSFHHVGLTVADLDRSRRFYRDVVGMREELCMDVASAAFDQLMDAKGLAIRFCYLVLGPLWLQLIEYTQGGEAAPLTLAHNRIGNPHLSIAVDDVAATYASIRARGDVRIVSGIVTQVHGSMRADSFYVLDPDGVQVEFGRISGG